MEQEFINNVYNKQEYLPMQKGNYNTSLFLKQIVFSFFCVVMTISVVAQERFSLIKKDRLERIEFEEVLPSGFGITKAYQFVYLVRPSFSEEYCMTYDSINKSLLLCKSKSRIGYVIGEDESKRARKKRLETYLLPIDDAYVDSLHSLYCAMINSASLVELNYGLDGVIYRFYLPTDIYTVAETWGGYLQQQNCGRVVQLMDRLCVAVETGNSDGAEQLREEIVALTAVFRSLPPASKVN